MNNRGPIIVQKNMDWFIITQLVVVIIVAFFYGLFFGWAGSIGVLSGGIAIIVPGWIFVKKLFHRTGATQTGKIIRNLYVGEVLKLVITAVISVLFLAFIRVNVLSFFVGFIMAQMAYWLAPFVVFKNKR